MCCDRSKSAHGFTLVELLVALAMLALMSVFTYRAVSSALDAEAHVKEISNQWLNLATFFDQFERDAMQAIPRPIRGKTGTLESSLLLRTDGQEESQTDIEWTRIGEVITESGGSRRIGYRLHEGKLQQLRWPVLDRAPSTEMQTITIQENIRSFRVRCLTSDGRWTTQWPQGQIATDLPRALEVTLGLKDGSTVTRLFPLGGA